MKDKNTPLIRQYLQIKANYPNHILLYRMGDFYETFFEDAEKTAQACNIILTKRNNGAAGDVPLAGFPYHQLENYLPKLINAGYRVAICEQVEDPKLAKGIVRREVVEVVTPGVTINEKLLSNKSNNFVSAIYLNPKLDRNKTLGFAFCDVSTGEFFISEFQLGLLQDILTNLDVKEVIISKEQKQILENILQKINPNLLITKLEPWVFDFSFAKDGITGKFKTLTLKGFGIENLPLGITASGALLFYIKETQKIYLNQIQKISLYNPFEYMILDEATRRNLEIHTTWSTLQTGSLLSLLDETQTPMGSRLLRIWITHPLINLQKINERLSVVEHFSENEQFSEQISKILSDIPDLERITARICSNRALPREVLTLGNCLNQLPTLTNLLKSSNNRRLQELAEKIVLLESIKNLIFESIDPNTTNTLGSGTVIKSNFNQKFDELRNLAINGKEIINQIQDQERQKTGIPTLKIGFNNVFGYYIEVSKIHARKVPKHYTHKQTLVNAERYTTPELREIEHKLINIQQEIQSLETALFSQILARIAEYATELQENAKVIAEIDCLTNYAKISKKYNFTRPIVDEGYEIIIEDGRHPVVEKNLPFGEKYTPNSTKLTPNEFIHIITGPNMSGKSCYLRQVGLIVLLAQIGCFVPAKSAKIGIVDRIFTRVGAQDNISQGESTFLVEMQESANILNNATRRSLILLDEVGRGTATFDGISIAWAITEFIHNHIQAKTLFATHFHELNELAEKYEKISNYFVEVIEQGEQVIFTHKVKKGASDHSFGIYVAEMAGLPQSVIERAKEILETLEAGTNKPGNQELFKVNKPNPKKIKSIERKPFYQQLAIFDFSNSEIIEKIQNLDLNNITPLQALKILEELQNQIKNQ